MKKLIATLITLMLGANPIALSQEFEPNDLKIDAIECVGNQITQCEVIKSEIYLSAGDRLNEEELQNSKIRLQLLGLFRSVDLSLKKGSQRGHVIVTVEVVEGSPYFFENTGTLSYSTYDGLGVALTSKIGNRNMFGKGKILQGTLIPLGIIGSNIDSYKAEIEYIDPHINGHQMYFFNTKLSYSNYNLTTDSTTYVYTDEMYDLEFNIGKRIFDFSYISIGTTHVKFERIQKSADDPQEKNIDYTNNYYNITYGWNNEDDPYFPTQGSTFGLSLYHWTDQTKTTQLKFKKNYLINTNHHISFDFFDSSLLDGWENYHYVNTGIEYGFQSRRANYNKDISSLRFFVKPQMTFIQRSESYYNKLETGIIFDSETFGIVKFNVFLGWL